MAISLGIYPTFSDNPISRYSHQLQTLSWRFRDASVELADVLREGLPEPATAEEFGDTRRVCLEVIQTWPKLSVLCGKPWKHHVKPVKLIL